MKNLEPLLAKLMNFLAEKYKNQLVLKGGMLLRLLDSTRATQDLDYAWIRTKKKNIFAEELKLSLESLIGIQVTRVDVNSRGIFLELLEQNSNLRAKLEISVVKALHCSPKPMTTAPLSAPYSLKPHVVATMDLSEAFSNKIAAALERHLARDLYDLMILGRLTSFDEVTLRDRLSRLEIRRAKPKPVTPQEAAVVLQKRIDSLTQETLKVELTAHLSGESLEGMAMIIKSAVAKIVAQLERL